MNDRLSNINNLYNGFSYREKECGSSDGFILEKASEDLPKRIYFKRDNGYLVDHFVLSIFSRVSAKAPESKIHDIKHNGDSTFYLGTNGMTRSYMKNGVLKRQIFTHDSPEQRNLTKEQIKKFMVSLAKLRILIYVFGLTDVHDHGMNIGCIDKYRNSNKSGIVKVGIVDFITPIKHRIINGSTICSWAPPYTNYFPYGGTILESKVAEQLNTSIVPLLSTFIQSCGVEEEPVVSDYRQAINEIRHPKVKVFDENGYLVSSSEGKKTEFEKVLEEVFKDLKKECNTLRRGVERPPRSSHNYSILSTLADDLKSVEIYKDIIKRRFLDLESIVVEKNVLNKFVNSVPIVPLVILSLFIMVLFENWLYVYLFIFTYILIKALIYFIF